jgi:cytochrome P450
VSRRLSVIRVSFYDTDIHITLRMDLRWPLSRLPYGERWRRSRKLLHAHVHQGVAHQYHSIQVDSARRFVREVLTIKPESEALPQAIRDSIGRTIIKIIYGIDVKDAESEYISLPEKVIRYTIEGGTPGRFLVDSLPICECRSLARLSMRRILTVLQ